MAPAYTLLEPDAHRPRRFGFLKKHLLLFLSLAFNFLAFIVILRRPHDLTDIFSSRIFFGDSWYGGLENASQDSADVGDLERCASTRSQPLPSSPPAPINPWTSLTLEELSQIESWLEAPERGLNLTKTTSSRTSDNIIFLIEAYYPAKEAALAYLSTPVAELLPERYARVTIHHGGWKEPVVKDYLVGPLPIGSATKMRPLTEIYHRADIPFNARGLSTIGEMTLVLAQQMAPISDILQELFGATARGLPNDTLVAGMSGPFSFDGSFRRLWMTWRRNHAGSYLLPVNFYQYLDVSGTDPSQWKVLKHIYHGQVFNTIESFIEAFHNGTLIRHPEQADPNLDVSWTERTRRGPDRDLDHLPGPRSVSFAGLRFRVDREQQHISWLGWKMYLGFDRDMGLSFWDIRFRGERIIYQLSPQEAIAQYGGNDPLQASTAWLDRHFGMGSLVRNMIPYYDCPQESVYLPATTYTNFGIVHVERAICIFEQDSGKPLSRHFGYEEGEFGAVKSYVLTVRSTTTFDYLFYLDGTIEVRLSASGYMQGGYWNEKQDGYGGRIHYTSMGNLHDHVINYKVDFDIAGTANSLLKTTTNQEEIDHPWLDDDWGQRVVQQKITKEYITNEDDALLKYPPNFQGGYAVVNQNATNTWGVPRGYAIHPGYNAIHNTVVGSKRLLNNANWARYNLAVSRRKETEPASSSMWNLNLPGAPTVDFHNFFNGENITQEDLVAWVNLGMHHLPQAEDSPHTKTNIATSSFVLTPLNYFDYDISMELKNAILLHTPQTPGDPYTFDDYGVKQDFTCVPERPSPFEYPQTQVFSPDGTLSFANSPDIRRAAEMHLRVRIGT
ncbi:amine oxidase catalytic domain-containing protein [Pholiota conissans]|uniref:Amine oxidase n=1 Tax=Pholiota conissans TaxID=109636 RepID=A0A9P5YXY6_9AGAR|nr:amine oxidase catalytic domain-containing protein [Pholiota conissans]